MGLGAAASLLRERGHEVHPLILPGLAERADEHSAAVTLTDHVEDVLLTLAGRDLRDVVLLGHSHGGIVAGMVANWAGDRIAHTVFWTPTSPSTGSRWSAAGRSRASRSRRFAARGTSSRSRPGMVSTPERLADVLDRVSR